MTTDTISEMHRKYGFGPGSCSTCGYMHRVKGFGYVCSHAVPFLVWVDRTGHWDKSRPACGAKKGRE